MVGSAQEQVDAYVGWVAGTGTDVRCAVSHILKADTNPRHAFKLITSAITSHTQPSIVPGNAARPADLFVLGSTGTSKLQLTFIPVFPTTRTELLEFQAPPYMPPFVLTGLLIAEEACPKCTIAPSL